MKLVPTLLLFASPALASDVIVVDASGGGDFTNLEDAVAATGEGDILLVRSGTYDADPPLSLPDRSLALVADSNGPVTVVGEIDLLQLAAHRTVLFSGLQIEGSKEGQHGSSDEVVLLWGPEGRVRVDSCSITGKAGVSADYRQHALRVLGSDDVAIISTTARGGDAPEQCDSWTDSGAGLRQFQSTVATWRSSFHGGNGRDHFMDYCPAGRGASGALVDGELYAFHDFFAGGDGADCQDFTPCCSDGANGVTLLDGKLVDQSSVFVGGEGGVYYGDGSQCDDGDGLVLQRGQYQPLDGAPRALLGPRVAREGESLTFEVFGVSGDRVRLVASTATEFSFAPALHGGWIVPRFAPMSHELVGTIPSDGSLTFVQTAPELGPGVEGRVLYLQAVLDDTAGERHLSSPRTLTLLDASL